MRFPLALASCLLAALAFRLVAEEPAIPDYPPPAEVKAAFLKQLDRPRVPLDPQVEPAKVEANGYVSERFSIATEKKADGSIERMPAWLIKPQKGDSKSEGRLPCVIVMHGTGGNKEGLRDFMMELAKRGIIGVSIDARYHGARSGGAKGSAAYVEAITRAWKAKPGEPQEYPFYYDTVWDLWRMVDYLVSRDDVDPQRIGMFGISMGGIQTWLAAAVDERVKVAVPAIGVQSFRWSLENDLWQGRARTIQGAHDTAAKDLGEKAVNRRVCRELWSKVIPGILDQFDCPSLLRLFADRELLILNGEKDPNCPLGGAKIAIASAEKAFREARREAHLKVMVSEGVAHAFTPQHRAASLEFLAEKLKD